MGLQSHLNDVSSESIPLLVFALIANCIRYLRSLLLKLTQSVGSIRVGSDSVVVVHDGPLTTTTMGSGLASLVVLAEQLRLNRVFSHRYGADGCGSGLGSDCVVCLCRLRNGDMVRRLGCGHVFHKECFDGWLDHMNFNCPLCRLPLVSDERVASLERRVGGDIISWFSSSFTSPS
ncbi:Zinc finger, RING-type [Dillenia turbinata]|uniref:Zinc finger, RING-type n=2 Tax=Dillenia turbinata TaxID=194707 RepID=A0AAN8UVX4_9MAGN